MTSSRLLPAVALALLLAPLAAQGSDDCASAQPITGVGSWVFDNTFATTDGNANALCAFLGASQIRNDVWFSWTPPSSGPFWVQTCSLTIVDTRIAVYGSDCSSAMVACDDDGCSFFQSRLLVQAVEGVPILIRIGCYPGALTGVGRFVILPASPVENPDNGNHYQIVGERTTWQGARVEAALRNFQGVPGHLATITSNGENFFVFYNLGAAGLDRYWLGGRQDPNAPTFSEPAGGWVWLTGEPLEGSYENWAPGQPDDAGSGENSVAYVDSARWVDEPDLFLNNDGYVIEYETGSLVGQNYCVSSINSTGSPALIAASGSTSIGDNFLTLYTFPCPDQPGLFYYGPFQVLVPFGNGFRCVGGQLIRLPAGPGQGGYLRQTLNFAGDPLLSPIAPGSTWHFQTWYRDPLDGGAFFNLSDALTLQFAP